MASWCNKHSSLGLLLLVSAGCQNAPSADGNSANIPRPSSKASTWNLARSIAGAHPDGRQRRSHHEKRTTIVAMTPVVDTVAQPPSLSTD